MLAPLYCRVRTVSHGLRWEAAFRLTVVVCDVLRGVLERRLNEASFLAWVATRNGRLAGRFIWAPSGSRVRHQGALPG